MMMMISYIWWNVRGVESSVEVFLALSHSQAELANISWPVGVLWIGMLENVATLLKRKKLAMTAVLAM